LVVVEATAAAGSELALPAGWVPDFSSVQAVEYPVDEDPVSELSLSEVRLRVRPAATTIAVPASFAGGETVRLTYTATHVVDAETDTLPPQHRAAVAALAASMICGQLAAYYASESAPTLGADVADHQGKSQRFRDRARDLLAEYNKTLGIADRTGTAGGATQAAGVVVSMDGRNADGTPRLFHGRRRR
jgi:hypothetical protein